MLPFLAKAQGPDLSGSQWALILLNLAIFVAVAALALAPVVIARQRGHRYAQVILALTVFWALLLAGSAIHTALAEDAWARQWLVDVQTGYLDPKDRTGAPVWPWGLWGALGVVYVGLVGWAAVGKRRRDW